MNFPIHIHQWALSVALLLVSTESFGQQIILEVSSRSITMEDTLELKIRLQGDMDQYEEPNLKDWHVIQSGSSSQTQIINGRINRERIFTKVLEPRREGQLLIGGAKAFRNGQKVSSAKPIPIQVRAQANQPVVSPQAAGDLKSMIGQDMFVAPSVSDASPFEGEPFVLSFYLYFKRGSNLSSERVQMPSLDGVLSEDLLNGENPKVTQRLGPYRYERVTLRQELLIPLRSGKISVAPLRMTLRGGGFLNQTRRKVASLPFDIQVREIPASPDQPGSVPNLGNFKMEGVFDKARATVGERRILTLTIRGNGNLSTMQAPRLKDSPHFLFEPLEGEDRSKILRDKTGMHGEVSFLYMVTPRKAGKLTLPPISVNGFDPKKEQHYTIASSTLTLNVSRGASGALGEIPGENLGLKPLAHRLDVPTKEEAALPPLWGFALSLGLPLMLFLGGRGRRWFMERTPVQTSLMETRQAKESLKALIQGEPGDQFHKKLDIIARSWFEKQWGFSVDQVHPSALRQSMLDRGAQEGWAKQWIHWSQRRDEIRFSPLGNPEEGRQDLVNELLTLLDSAQNGGSHE